jgi:hypothetical protein
MTREFLMKLLWLPARIHFLSADCSHDSVLQQCKSTTCIQSLPLTLTNCDPSLGSLNPRTLVPSQTGLTPYKIDCTTPSHFLGPGAAPIRQKKSQTESRLVQIRPSSRPGPLGAPGEHFRGRTATASEWMSHELAVGRSEGGGRMVDRGFVMRGGLARRPAGDTSRPLTMMTWRV